MFKVISFCEDYTVKKGDTLSNIAEKQLGDKTKWKEIAKLNNLKSPYRIKLNQILELPSINSITTITQSETSKKEVKNDDDEDDSDDNIFPIKPLIIWGIFIFILQVLFLALSIRVGCWFSLIETTAWSCIKLAFFIAMMTIATIATTVFLIKLHVDTQLPTLGFFSTGFVLTVGYCIFIIITAKKILKCLWRSLITLLIMTLTMGEMAVLLAIWLLALALPKILSLDIIQNIWNQIPF